MKSLAKQLASNLPEEPALALLELRDRIAERLEDPNTNVLEVGQMLAVVSAWHHKYGKQVKWEWPTRQVKDTDFDYANKLIVFIGDFERHVHRDIAKKEAESVFETEEEIRNRETFGIAVIRPEEKDKIRYHIENIRNLINDSNIPDRKRVVLLKRLMQLESELETIGTRTDRFFAFMGDAAFALGDFAKKAKPFTDEVKSIMKIVLKSREDTEGVRLPRKGDEMLLPPPDEV